jgi:hypothetical protein
MTLKHRTVRDLADQLVVEYAGALPPGQVLALVHRTAHRLARFPGAGPDWQSSTVEELARHALSERVGLLSAGAA